MNGGLHQQIAWALALAVEYFASLDGKVEARAFFEGIMFTFPVGNKFLPEVAKLRAFRLLLDRVINQKMIGNLEEMDTNDFTIQPQLFEDLIETIQMATTFERANPCET